MPHELIGEHFVRILAREAWLLGARQTEVQALEFELASGRWYQFRIEGPRGGWVGEWLDAAPPAGAVGDDADSRHPLVDVATHFGIKPGRIDGVTTRQLGELAELALEFGDATRLVAHYRPPPGTSSLTCTKLPGYAAG